MKAFRVKPNNKRNKKQVLMARLLSRELNKPETIEWVKNEVHNRIINLFLYGPKALHDPS